MLAPPPLIRNTPLILGVNKSHDAFGFVILLKLNEIAITINIPKMKNRSSTPLINIKIILEMYTKNPKTLCIYILIVYNIRSKILSLNTLILELGVHTTLFLVIIRSL